jgi:hypothetical protein
VLVQPDGKIVATGWSGGDFGVVRYRSTGVLDSTFSADGKTRTGFRGYDTAEAVAQQPSGRIVVAGSTVGEPDASGEPDDVDFAVTAYTIQ